MVKEDKATWKANYFLKLQRMLDEYPKSFIVGVDNVGSKQMQEIRLALRGNAELMMGKNTMIRKVIRGNLQKNPRLEKLLGHIVGNVGFVFTKGDMSEVRELILEKKVAAPAKAGALAPIDVFIDAQNTGLGPEKTSFFQALSIPTKIAKGTIEILSKVHLIKAGERVGASEATLLNMLDISPFTYGLVIQMVYDDGTVFEPHVLDMTQADLRARFLMGVRNVAALSMAINYPTAASVPHMIANGMKNLMALAAAEDGIEFKQAAKLKEYLKDPSKFAAAVVAAAPAPAAAGGGGKKEEAKKEEKKEEPEEEEDLGFGLFD